MRKEEQSQEAFNESFDTAVIKPKTEEDALKIRKQKQENAGVDKLIKNGGFHFRRVKNNSGHLLWASIIL